MKKQLTCTLLTGTFIALSSFSMAAGVDTDTSRMKTQDRVNMNNNRVNSENQADLDNNRINPQDRVDSQDRVGSQNYEENETTEQERTAAAAEKRSHDREDLGMTERIRRGMDQNKDLSTSAKKVVVLTSSGKVVLRGPVESSEERSEIEKIAKNIAGPKNVENRIIVKE